MAVSDSAEGRLKRRPFRRPTADLISYNVGSATYSKTNYLCRRYGHISYPSSDVGRLSNTDTFAKMQMVYRGETEVQLENAKRTALTCLSYQQRQLLFAGLKNEVNRSFYMLDPQARGRWATSAQKLTEILEFFERVPHDAEGCSMVKAVELACEFTIQAIPSEYENANSTIH
ncbi:hypothetical protein GCM10010924_40690 [Rhizobium wenxiniae]|nr:hypothetical protein GCM10010924_40690 [Rhizobium wenxiniae]